MCLQFSKYFFLVVMGFTSLLAKAQITVSGSAGADGTYSSLTSGSGAFMAINTSGSQAGKSIVITITASLSNENGPNGLNPNNWNSLTIKPSGAITISANNTGPLIDLNGADNVTINGLNSSGNSLTLTNTGSSNSANVTTIRYINDATNNTITNCTILGSSSNSSTGTIVFAGGSSTGNDNNTISNCTIGPAGSNLPSNAIYSAGSSITIDNSGNSILNNSIQDYYNASIASNGIFIASNSSAWTISGNKFFQTATRTATASKTNRAINIITASGVGYTVSNNVIGFANSSATGVTTYNGSFANVFIGIEISVGTASVSNVQGNTISGISLFTTSAAAAPGIFSGISILSGAVNIGTASGNIIGASSGIGSISITSSANGADICGIYATSTNNVFIQNNLIGSINTGGSAVIGFELFGIYTAGSGSFTISSNTIGSATTAHSMAAGTNVVTTTGVCTFAGIRTSNTGNKIITNNIIQNCTSYGTGNSLYYGIYNSGSSGTLLIRSNKVISGTNTGSSTATVGDFTCIFNTVAVSTATINLNEIRNHVRTNTTGLYIGISNTGAVTTSIKLDSNQLGNSTGGLITFSQTNSRALIGINNSGSGVAASLSIQYNDIRGIVNTVAASHTHNYIINSAIPISQNISNNTFSNLSVNTTGAIIFISNNSVMAANGTQTINNNRIVGTYTNNAASGSLTIFTSTASTAASNVTVNHNNNNFSNITVAGTTTISGWISTDLGTASVIRNIQNNVFRNWNGGTGAITVINVNIKSMNNSTSGNTISDIASSGSITGINTGLVTTGTGNDNIYLNTIDSLVSTGTSSSIIGIAVIPNGANKNIYKNTIFHLQGNSLTSGIIAGISVSGGTSNSIYENKIYNLFSNSSAISSAAINGILITGSAASMISTIKNNIIGDLRATAANYSDAIRGINIISTGTTSSIAVYFNTIYINASSTGTVFGTTGIYHTTSATATTATLDLRNNIIVNASTPNSTGITAAYRRSSSTNANFSNSSNNNLFYGGTPGTNKVILYNGTGYQTLANYKTYVGATIDAASVTDDMITTSKFLSTSGLSTNFLKIDSTKFCTAESAGANISGISTDFRGIIRQGNAGYTGTGSKPDIGAYEMEGPWQWTGATNTTWATGGNWHTGVVPNSGISLVLNSGLSNYPVITSGTIIVNNITIQTGASFTLNNAELIIKGNIVNNGTFNVSTGTVQFNGTSAQVIPAGAFSGNIIKNLNLNNASGVSLNGTLGVKGILKATTGNFTTDGHLTLLSDSNQTALIDGTGNGEVIGNVIMQRFIDSAFGYKYISSPFQSAKVSQLYDDINFGASFPIFYKYDENKITSGWVNYDTSQVMATMEGYAVNFGTVGNDKNIDILGVVNNGPKQITLYNNNKTTTQGFNLVGNPYPSPINWNASSGWTKTNIDDAIYFFDAGNGDEYVGTYSSYANGVSSNGLTDNIIGSMQGFFVHVSNGSFPVTATLGVTNSVRINNLTEILQKRDTQPEWPLIRLKCFYEANKSSTDATVLYFKDNVTNYFDKEADALKLMNIGKNVPNIYSISMDSRKLSISALPINKDSIQIYPLGINIQSGGKLVIKAEDINKMRDGLNIYLYDADTRTLQNLRNQHYYTFTENKLANENRFYLVLSINDIQYLSGVQNDFKTYIREGQLYFSLNPLLHEADLIITTMQGQVIYTRKITDSSEQEINMKGASGIYILSVQSSKGKNSRKIFITAQ